MRLSNVFAFLITLAIIGLAALGVIQVYHEKKMEQNQCLMSWMNPNYIPVKVEPPHPTLSSKYKLYLYREGRFARQEIGRLTGVPVLFVHGNAGSYKQVRSIGIATVLDKTQVPMLDSHIKAIVQRQAGLNHKVELDVFAVDFEEELSALHGQLLWDQADFVNYAIQTIRSHYQGDKHKSVITVGHSIGGMVLRAAPLLPSYQPQTINTIITMSTPHVDHPFLFDRSLHQFYSHVNNEWKKQIRDPRSDIHDTVLISISGGFRDTLVRSDTTLLDDVIPPSNGFSVSAYSVPYVRTSADHLSVMWCKQLIQVVGNYLVDLVNDPKNSKQGKYDLDLPTRLDIAKKNFYSVSSYGRVMNIKHSKPEEQEFKIKRKPETLMLEGGTFKFDANHKPKSNVYQIDLNSLRNQNRNNIVITTNMNQYEYFVFGRKNGKVVDLDSEIETLPYVRKTERHMQEENVDPSISHTIVQLDSSQLEDYEHLILYFEEESLKWHDIRMIVHAYNSDSSKVNLKDLSVSNLFDSLVKVERNFIGVHKLHFSSLSRQFNYKIKLSDQNSDPPLLYPSAYYYFANKREDGHIVFEDRYVEDAREFTIKFFTSTSLEVNDFTVYIFTDPNSSFTISVTYDWLNILGSAIRFNAGPIAASAFAFLFFALASQARSNWYQSINRSAAQVLYTRLIFTIVTITIAFVLHYDIFLNVLGDGIPFVSIADDYLVNLEMSTQKKVQSFLRQNSTLVPTFPLEQTRENLYPKRALHQNHVLYVVLSLLFGYALLQIIVSLLRVINALLNITVIRVIKIVSGLFPTTPGWLNIGFWVLIANSFAVFSHGKIHSGIFLVLSIVIMLLVSSYKLNTTLPTTRNLRLSLLTLFVMSSLLTAPSIIIFVKELLLRVELNQSKTNILQKVFNSLPDHQFADSFQLLLGPLFWLLVSLSNEVLFPQGQSSRFIAPLLEIAGIATLATCRFLSYRLMYITFFVSIILFFNICRGIILKPFNKTKNE
ncbi:GPI inositol-deacylase [Acrasis kona]|uniref:GPI inositol-deacylase n=1 Tax=Acrasis kona TaxID=1008807 RepID=A0AAW2Z578_9EUKA